MTGKLGIRLLAQNAEKEYG